MDFKIIATDFDGTLCENKWPEIGAPNEEVIDYLKNQKQPGDVKLILWTCRDGKPLEDAICWCREHGLTFDEVNNNTPEVIKEFGGNPRKVFAHEYIEDRNCSWFDLPYVIY